MTDKSPEWIARHRATIGGSLSAACLGEHPYVTPAQAFDYLTGVGDSAEPNYHMERGQLLEPIARHKLAQHLGVEITEHDQDVFLYALAYPFAHTLPDGWIDGTIPVELKVPTPQGWQQLKLRGMHGYWLIQCMHTIAVTGAPRLEFGALNPVTVQILPITVERNDELISLIMDRERAFMENVRAGIRPQEHDAERLELPDVGGEMIRLHGDDALNAAAALIEAMTIRKEAEELEEAAKDRIKTLMGDAQVAELPGIRAYHRYQDGRATFDKKALAKAHPEIDLSQFEKVGDPFRVFKSYRIGA